MDVLVLIFLENFVDFFEEKCHLTDVSMPKFTD